MLRWESPQRLLRAEDREELRRRLTQVRERVTDAALTGRFEISTSPSLLDELRRVLTQPKLQAVTGDPDQLVELRALAAIVIRPTETVENARDPDDDRLIHAALSRIDDISILPPRESSRLSNTPTAARAPNRCVRT